MLAGKGSSGSDRLYIMSDQTFHRYFRHSIMDKYGDIVLYSGNQIVVFYGSNSWAYTRLGHIDMTQEELTELLGNGDAEITIE